MESRVYNALNQLVVLTGGNVNISYIYSNTANNGQITNMTDNVLGQTTNYTYDALKRLSHADSYIGSSLQWYQQYDYDGFGNMTGKNGNSGMVFTNSVNGSNNRLTGGTIAYDNNGNLTTDQNNYSYVYDIGNRMVRAQTANNGYETYQYSADNKRLSKIAFTQNSNYSYNFSQTVYIYGAMGEKLTVASNPGGSAAVANNGSAWGASIGSSTLYATNNVYWSGRMIAQSSSLAAGQSNYINLTGIDRLGSVISDGTTSKALYLPYGEDINSSANDRVKFATYTRDGSTGLDYADQRFYTSQFGRFMSADRFEQTPDTDDSGSWNKYSYTRGDPINWVDITGQFECNPESPSCQPADPGPGGGGGTGGPGTPCTAVQSGPSANCAGSAGGSPAVLPVLHDANKKQQKAFQAAVAKAISIIDKNSDCSGLFGGAQKGDSALENAFFDYGTTAALTAAGPGAAAQTNPQLNTIIINSAGWFFDPIQSGPNGTTLNYGQSTGLSGVSLQAFVLLHELGHLTGAFGATDNDGTSVANQNANNTLIDKDCFGKQYKPVQ